MAKINEEIIVVKISTLLPDAAEMTPIMAGENLEALTAVIREMVGDHRTLVEIERA